MSKIREIYQMEQRLRTRSPKRLHVIRTSHAKTFDHLDRRGGASGKMPKSPALARRVEALHDELSRIRNPKSSKGVTISQTLGLLMLDYVNEHDPKVSAFETIAAEAASDERGTRVPLKLAVKARAEIVDLLEIQTDPMAREELEGFLDNFDFAIEKARRKNPSSVKKLAKKTRARKAKKGAKRTAAVRGAARDARKSRVKSVLKTLERNPSKSSLDMYVSMIPTLTDEELKTEKAAVKRRISAVEKRDRGPGKTFRLTQLRKMYNELEDERLGRIAPNPPSKVRRKSGSRRVHSLTDDDIRLVEKYGLQERLMQLEPDQIECMIQRVRVEDIRADEVAQSRKRLRESAKRMRDRRKMEHDAARTRKVGRYPKVSAEIEDVEAFDIPPEHFDEKKTRKYLKVQRDVINDGKLSRARASNPLKKVTERTPEDRFRKAVRENTKTEISMGRPPEQAYAIALSMARKQAPNRAKKIYGLPPKRNPKSKKKGRRRWGSGARAAAGGAVGGLALGLPGAAAGAYVGATRELRKRKENPMSASDLVKECRRLWDRYCERPGVARLRAVAKHCERMAQSAAKSVKKERARCMRAIKAEAKSRKFKL